MLSVAKKVRAQKMQKQQNKNDFTAEQLPINASQSTINGATIL